MDCVQELGCEFFVLFCEYNNAYLWKIIFSQAATTLTT